MSSNVWVESLPNFPFVKAAPSSRDYMSPGVYRSVLYLIMPISQSLRDIFFQCTWSVCQTARALSYHKQAAAVFYRVIEKDGRDLKPL